jgi:hypothetical protein
MLPLGSVDPDPLKASVVRVCVNWSGPACATGTWFPTIVVVVVGDVGVLVLVVVVGATAAVVVVTVLGHVVALTTAE